MATLQEFQLGPARLCEAARIAEMSRRWIEHGLTWRYRPESIARKIGEPDTEVVVARSGDLVIGFAVMEFHFEVQRAHVVLLAVEPAYRRRGVGDSLFRWLDKMAVLAGIGRIGLELRAENDEARVFYEHLGFRETGSHRAYYDGREDAIVMQRQTGVT
jgi:ribosomal-protein-alanine acetyltransferase